MIKDSFSRFGAPLELHSDQRRNLENELFRNIYDRLSIRKTRKALQSLSDGMIEGMNKIMGMYPSNVVSNYR